MNANGRDESTRRINRLFALIVLAAIGFAVFLPGLGTKYCDDDFQFVYSEPSRAILYYFSHDNPANSFYRPLQAMFLAGVQSLAGLNTIPIHVTNLILHILLAWLVLLAMTRLGFSLVQSFGGALFMLISQANVHAVSSNDTLSQVGSTLAGVLALYALIRAMNGIFKKGAVKEERTKKNRNVAAHTDLQNSSLVPKDTSPESPLYTSSEKPSASAAETAGSARGSAYGYYILSVVLFAISLIFKETAVSFLLITAVMLFSARWIHKLPRGNTALLRAAVLLLPYIAVTLSYLFVRSQVVTSRAAFGSNPYNFHIGFNIARNLALLFTAAASPISTVTLYTAAKTGHAAGFSIYITVAAIFVVPTICGLARLRKNKAVLLAFAFSILALFPAFLLNHVSELYVYNAMPFIALLVGAGFGLFAERSDVKLEKTIAVAVAIVVGASNIGAIASKTSLMWENGERAQVIITQLKHTIKTHPQCSCLYLVNPQCEMVEYSIFTYNGFHIVKNSLQYIKESTNREDLDIEIITSSEYANLDKSLLKNCVFLTTTSCRGAGVKTLNE